MIDSVKKDILDILKGSLKAIRKNDIIELKDLSNHTIHNASIFQDPHSVSTAVLMYSLSKIFERSRYRDYDDWNLFYDTCISDLQMAALALSKDKEKEYEKYITDLLKVMNKLDSKLRVYIEEVFDRAKISKGSRLHEHGLSLGRTAKILGVSEWELMDYTGKTGIADVKLSLSKNIDERLKLARSLFK